MLIVLDAGHVWGYNQSPAYKEYREGNMTWKLYGFLKAELESMGHRVVGTRGNVSKDLEVYQRGTKAAGADLFISLHSNAVGDAAVRRVVVIPPFKDTNNTYDLANRLGASVSACMGIDDRYQIYTRTYADTSGKTVDYYGVIRGAVAGGCKRSMIIEHGFHTNPAVAKWLCSEENLKRLAKREAEVINDFFFEQGGVPQKYAVGDYYTVKAGDKYSNGRSVAAFAVGQTYKVKQILPGKILLDAINSWVVVP